VVAICKNSLHLLAAASIWRAAFVAWPRTFATAQHDLIGYDGCRRLPAMSQRIA